MSDLAARATDTIAAHLRLWGEHWRVQKKKMLSPSSVSPSDKRLLLLVGEFAPAIAGGVYRPAALARYASQAGWCVTVVTGQAPPSPSAAGKRLLEYVGANVRVERFSPPTLVPSYRLFPQVDGGMLGALDMVAAVHRCFGNDVPQTIIATGPPFSSFVAGWFLARQHGARLVLDYRDEWSECPFDFVAKTPAGRVWEAKCLAHAERIVVTTESQHQHLAKIFGAAIGSKCSVVPNGWEPAESQEVIVPNSRTLDRRIVLTFAGKLGGHTDPKLFLDAVQSVLAHRPELRKQLLLRFVGYKRDDALLQLQSFPMQDVIELVPVVPLAEAARLMRESDALLLLHDSRFDRYLPGKLYEYAASGTPVLLIDDDGESDRLVRSLNLGWSVHHGDLDSLAKVLEELGMRRSIGDLHQSSRSTDLDEWLRRHTRENLAHQFLSLVDNNE